MTSLPSRPAAVTAEQVEGLRCWLREQNFGDVAADGTVRLLSGFRWAVSDLPWGDTAGEQVPLPVMDWCRVAVHAGLFTGDVLTDTLRVMALPRGHVRHPGAGWVQETVRGDVLDMGLGMLGADSDMPDVAVPVPAVVAEAAGWDVSAVWPLLRARHERAAALAGGWALKRAGGRGGIQSVPVGGHSVVTLLCAAEFRSVLAGTDGGMAPFAAPGLDCGWFASTLSDDELARVTVGLFSPPEQGFAQCVLVTADEVTIPVPRGTR